MRPHVSFCPTGRVCVERVRIPDAPACLSGRIVFASDIHVNRGFSDRALERLFLRVRQAAPDLFLLGGDYADDADGQRRFFCALKRLGPKCPALLALGNNDKESLPVRALRALAASAGANVLVNECAVVPFGAGQIAVGALDERKYGLPRPGEVFSGANEALYRILLSHYPFVPGEPLRVDLYLAGHTHGGQFRAFGLTPFSLGFERGYPLILGEGRVSGARAVVTGGVGVSRLPLRVGVAPQIHLLEFTKE